MENETGTKHIYVYKIGPFSLTFVILLASLFAVSGLYVVVGTVLKGALEDLPGAVLVGLAFMLVAAVLFRWLHKDNLSSQEIVLWENKVQRPMTKGTKESDFLLLNEIVGTKIDKDYHDHGPALIVETKSKCVAYKSMYFENYKSFEDFCGRLDSALEPDNFGSLEELLS